uniref:Uncharacterized protein n=1 Tax=Arundo donax TaxID=35708 RepID=A0A0A9F1I1_ARUDO
MRSFVSGIVNSVLLPNRSNFIRNLADPYAILFYVDVICLTF